MKPLYFLPGTMCDERLWARLWSYFDPSQSLVHVPIPMAENIDVMVETIAATLPNEAIDLVGFSLGGYLACDFALKYPARIKSLCIISNTPSKLPDAELMRRKAIIKWVTANGYSGVTARAIDPLLHEDHQGEPDIHRLVKAMDASLGEVTLLNQLGATSSRKNLVPALSDVTFPKALFFGDQDILVDKQALQTRHPWDKITEIKGAGHMLPLEKPSQLYAAMADFYSL